MEFSFKVKLTVCWYHVHYIYKAQVWRCKPDLISMSLVVASVAPPSSLTRLQSSHLRALQWIQLQEPELLLCGQCRRLSVPRRCSVVSAWWSRCCRCRCCWACAPQSRRNASHPHAHRLRTQIAENTTPTPQVGEHFFYFLFIFCKWVNFIR